LSVPSSVLVYLHFFSRFSRPEFQNPNCLVWWHSLLSCASIKAEKLGNPISHDGTMSFYWWSLVLVDPFFSFDTSSLFQPFLSLWVSKSKLSCAIA
jgi:hypothetical protein